MRGIGYGLFICMSTAFIAVELYLLETMTRLSGNIVLAVIIQFLVALYLFSRWRLYSSSLEGMSKSNLYDLRAEWLKGIDVTRSKSPGELRLVRRRNDHSKLAIALQRVIAIHEQLIARETSADTIRMLSECVKTFENELRQLDS